MKKNNHTLKKFVYIEYIELCTFFETLNIKYTKFCTFFEDLDIECTDLTLSVIYDEKCPHIKILWYLNIQNCIWRRKMSTHKKNCVYWTQNCVHSFENCVYFLKVWILNLLNCVHFLNIWTLNVQTLYSH